MRTERFLSLKEFDYKLPENRIALYPNSERDQSKLLVYRHNEITQDVFVNLPQYLPENSLLVFNDSKVIPARLIFHKATGAKIEVFCLEEITEQTNAANWKCFVGGAAKWKEETLTLTKEGGELNAKLLQNMDDAYEVSFTWNNESLSFYDILEQFGDIPLPPYLKRATTESDKSTYQTVYSAHKGSVAAPTAGLHFTNKVFNALDQKGIERLFVTLHVGAGTFKPIKTENVYDHAMHYEWIDVSKAFIQQIAESADKFIVPVGTTSLRTLETLYWLGVKELQEQGNGQYLVLKQWENESLDVKDVSIADAFNALCNYLNRNGLDKLIARTQIMITPEYSIKAAKAIITNFHQPESSLLLLINAFVGEDWKRIYYYAMENDFRFLSYGDSSLLFLE